MSTRYDDIAEQYQRSKHVSWRYHIEQYSLASLLGTISGKAVLDLACGEGHYTRLLRAMGASRVTGVDLSRRMIELAQVSEEQQPIGIEYVVGDARSLKASAAFDLVTAAYLLNYAQSRAELLSMCQAISGYLKPGGRFVTVNNNPGQDPRRFAATRKYGFVKSACSPITEGTAIRYTFFLGEDMFEIENYHLDRETHEWALREAGLTNIAWHQPQLSTGEAAKNPEEWRDFFIDPPVILLEAHKPA
jgi:ubiquinone/menaquinone biosynthesis C-methylase UbiE